MAGLRADVEPMPGSQNAAIQLVTPGNSSNQKSSGSTPIEFIKGQPSHLSESARQMAPPAEADDIVIHSSNRNSEPEASVDPTFTIRESQLQRKPRRKSNLPSLESLIDVEAGSKQGAKSDDTAPSVDRDVKRDPYFDKMLNEAQAKRLRQAQLEHEALLEQQRIEEAARQEQLLIEEIARIEQARIDEAARVEQQRIERDRQRFEQEQLAERTRLEQERLVQERIAEEQRREAEAQARILALPRELLKVPEPQSSEPFVPIPRVVHRTQIITKSVSDWLVMKEGSRPVLGSAEVGKLLTRARMEVAAGDLLMAHTFAEAAAEVEISVEMFKQKSDLILAEIEYVTSRRLSQPINKLVVFDETPAKQVEPESFAKQLQKDPRGYRAISSTSLNIKPAIQNSTGQPLELPVQQAKLRMAQLPEIMQGTGYGRGWSSLSYSWEAPAVRYAPLYFEQPELERYGNEFCYGLQPIVSGLDFFLSIPTLPYQMGIEGNGPLASVYDLGYDRPESCVPYSHHVLPFSWTGVATQAAATTGLVFILP